MARAAGTQRAAGSHEAAAAPKQPRCTGLSPAKQLQTNGAGSSARQRGADRAAVGYQVTEAGAARHFFLS